jgi:hypothetical protein
MALVTIQLIEGLERGQVYSELPTPVTIGREDDNSVRLNDERVSRFHAKIQEDGGRIILTDLDSTNGTRVNGHPVQMHVLQIGDQVLIGRCLLVYGSPQQLEQRIVELAGRRGDDDDGTVTSGVPARSAAEVIADLPGELFPDGPPPPPTGLTPLQRAQILDLVAFLHSGLVNVMHVTEADSRQSPQFMQMPLETWHRMQRLQLQLAECLKRINDP